MEKSTPSRVVSFGSFQLDLVSGELHKHGLKIKLQELPFRVLALLVEHPGELITREEFQKNLWPDTFVDFDHSLASAINKIREALGDSAENARFIETLPRRGYRFIAPLNDTLVRRSRDSSVSALVLQATAVPAQKSSSERSSTRSKRTRRLVWAGVLASAAALILLAGYISTWRQPLAGAGPTPIRSLAVLPLENLTGDPAQTYFTDGMTDELITDLAKIGTLRVISRSSVMRYKGSRQPLPEIARELNVDAVVEGGVVRAGNRVRVTAQLIRAATDQHLWAEEYERDLQDVLVLQSEVARAIARQIHVKLTAQESARVGNRRPVNPEAYETYLKGYFTLWSKWTPQSVQTAIEYFNRAIEKDPTFAPAYAGLADCYSLGFFRGVRIPPSEAIAHAEPAARKALQLDDQLAEAHTSMAAIRFRYYWDWQGAESEFKRAIELNPNYVTAHQLYGIYLSDSGRMAEAVAEIKRAHDLDPYSLIVNNNIATLLELQGRNDEAIDQCRKIVAIDPDFPTLVLAAAYEQKGMYTEMVSESLKRDAALGTDSMTIAGLQKAYLESGVAGFWREELREATRQLRRSYVSPLVIAQLHMRLGEKDEALLWLEKAYRDHHPYLVHVGVDPIFRDLHSDPRFLDLEHRIGLLRDSLGQ